MKTKSMLISEVILSLVELQVFAGKDKAYVEYLSNGLEQGFVLKSYDSKESISWAENRNSDEIVVYKNESPKYFKYNDIIHAVEYIVYLYENQSIN